MVNNTWLTNHLKSCFKLKCIFILSNTTNIVCVIQNIFYELSYRNKLIQLIQLSLLLIVEAQSSCRGLILVCYHHLFSTIITDEILQCSANKYNS